MARDGPFDVVLSDMRMPDMDGAAFLARVRVIARDTTRILLTGQADIDIAMIAVNDGQVFRFLAKPCPAQVLRQTLREAAEQHDRAVAEHEIIDRSLGMLAQAGPGAGQGEAPELAAALRAGQLEVWYQPIVDLASRQVSGAEALIRWQHPQRGLLLPGQFLPAAERGGLIIPISRWALLQACHAAAAWPDGPAGPLPVAVNLHPDHLRDPRVTDDVRSALESSGLPAGRLILEVTEAILIHDAATASRALGRLREMGISVAIDDFGSGYASLSYLQNLPVSTLKIDRAFIASLPDPTPVAITQTILQLSAALGLSTVAEGIETDSQLRACQELGCQRGQGFLFAEPMDATRLGRALRAQGASSPAGPQPGT
jgi:EAL domain-containing protein (putative c-di-GMP-specific phosphodiesterase class I)